MKSIRLFGVRFVFFNSGHSIRKWIGHSFEDGMEIRGLHIGPFGIHAHWSNARQRAKYVAANQADWDYQAYWNTPTAIRYAPETKASSSAS